MKNRSVEVLEEILSPRISLWSTFLSLLWKNKEFTWNKQKKVTSLKTDIIKGYGPGILTATINEAPATFIAIKTKNRDKRFLVAWFPADSLYLLGNLKALLSSSLSSQS